MPGTPEFSATACLDRLVDRVTQSGWSTLWIFLLHVIEPFETLAGQALLLLAPLVSGADDLAAIIQDHAQMSYLRERLEQYNADRSDQDQAEEQ